MNSKYIACDVQYVDDTGFAAGVCFNNLTDELPGQVAQAVVRPVADYVPGEFYLRELPCLLELLRTLQQLPQVVFVDGYVWLAGERPALGARLYEALNGTVAVIGVAKTSLKMAGESQQLSRAGHRPIYVSAAGIDLANAVEMVTVMHGDGRLPAMIQLADQEARALAFG
jgi:deoxyribonuclease V